MYTMEKETAAEEEQESSGSARSVSAGGRRSRTVSDSQSDPHFLGIHHSAYCLRRGSCPPVASASAVSRSLFYQKGRTPKRVHQIWTALHHGRRDTTLDDQLHNEQENGRPFTDEKKRQEKQGEEDETPKSSSSSPNMIECDAACIDRNLQIPTFANRFVIEESMTVHWLDWENFYVEFPQHDTNDRINEPILEAPMYVDKKKQDQKRSVRFSNSPLIVYSTYGPDEYDRSNPAVDPFTAYTIYELERRLDKKRIIDLEVTKGGSNERLGFDIVGMGVNADRAGSDCLSVFITSIVAGGAADRDGRLRRWDQIVEVDGERLVGVSQQFAASTLRNTGARVRLKIARDKNDPEKSEIAKLCKSNYHNNINNGKR